MDALHLPRRHLVGVTVLAALLTLTVMALLLLPGGRLAPADRSSAAPEGDGRAAPVVTTTAPVRPPFVERPAWMTDPLRPPSF